MDNNLPIFYLTIDEKDETGVEAVALVDTPAIERNWMAFKKNKPYSFEITNEEKRVVSGPLMVADFPVYRKENDQEYYVVFDKETIRKIVYKYMKAGLTKSVNEMHETPIEGVFMFESFIIDEKKPTPKGFSKLTEGSWFGSFKIENDDVWKKVKSGEFKGFSVEGGFNEGKRMDIDRMIIEEIESALSGTN